MAQLFFVVVLFEKNRAMRLISSVLTSVAIAGVAWFWAAMQGSIGYAGMLNRNVGYKVVGVERYTDFSVVMLKMGDDRITPCLF
ncbi:hypothetical protein, partial [Pseudomonas aeruginosa]|uniref:hypothetical protein n=1 Tax=Pseudomonas aeruginosa TaxID=287 RepID=UPI0011BE28DA